MPITYPLSHPTTPGFKRLTMKASTVVALTSSPFSLNQQVYQHQGELWRAGVTLPPMARADAENWVAFLLSLRGKAGTFLLGDPSGKTPRGSAAGAPTHVDGVGQTGIALNTLGWTASQSNILLPGDYIQLAKNYIVQPRAFDDASWVKNECTVTATNITAPNNTAEAERVTPTGGATNAYIRSTASPVPTRVVAETFYFSVWLKAAAGTPAVLIALYESPSGISTTQNCALTTSWQKFSVNRTIAAGQTDVIAQVGGGSSWPVADGAIDMWGGCLYAPALDAQLHKVLVAAASDSNTKSTLNIFPRLRESPTSFSAIITASAKGLFRLQSNEAQWDIDEALNFGLGFEAMEAI